MSGFINLEPLPMLLGAMSPADDDGAWLIDCTANCLARGTTLQSVTLLAVTRQDTQAIGAGDLTVSDVSVASAATTRNGVTSQPGYGFLFSAQTNGNTGIYDIEFTITFASGDEIVRTWKIPVLPLVG
jgi:hypothetical protein